jgi:hypothetical protein
MQPAHYRLGVHDKAKAKTMPGFLYPPWHCPWIRNAGPQRHVALVDFYAFAIANIFCTSSHCARSIHTVMLC